MTLVQIIMLILSATALVEGLYLIIFKRKESFGLTRASLALFCTVTFASFAAHLQPGASLNTVVDGASRDMMRAPGLTTFALMLLFVSFDTWTWWRSR